MSKIRNKDFLAVLFIVLLAICFFTTIIFHPHHIIFPAPDTILQYAFWRSFFVESFTKFNSLPLWSPHEFGGMPFLANPLTAVFYPGTILYFLFPSSDNAFGFHVLVDVILLGIFTYMYGRLVMKDRISSLLSSIAMMFSGAVIARINAGHISNLDVILWFPLLLLLVEVQIRKQTFTLSILTSFVIALMILAGHMQFAFYGFFAVLIYFSLRIGMKYVEDRNIFVIFKTTGLFIISFLLGIGLSAIQLLPTLELSAYSLRAGGTTYDFASSFSIPIPQLSTLLFPRIFGSPLLDDWWGRGNFGEFTGYVGILPLIFAVFALFFLNRYIVVFCVLTIFALLFSTGSYGFIFPFFYHYIPGFNLFRIPATFLYVASFSLALLGGFGMCAFLKKISEKKVSSQVTYFFRFVIFSFSFSTIIALFVIFNKKLIIETFQRSYKLPISNYDHVYGSLRHDVVMLWILLGSTLILIYLLLKKRINYILASGFFLMILIVDLFYFGMPLVQTKHPDEIYHDNYINSVMRTAEGYRIFDMTNKYTATLQRNKSEIVNGYNPSYLLAYREFFWLLGPHLPYEYEPFLIMHDITNPNILRLLHTKIVITEKKLTNPSLQLVKHDENFIYAVKDPLPRAYIVPEARVIKNEKQLLQEVDNGHWDPKRYAFFENDPKKNLRNTGSYLPVKKIDKKINEVSIQVDLTHPGFLILSEVWYPGWKAFVNGKETEIYKANYLFRSVYLEPGKNHVVFRFESSSYVWGKYITIISLFFCIIIFFISWIKNVIKNKKNVRIK